MTDFSITVILQGFEKFTPEAVSPFVRSAMTEALAMAQDEVRRNTPVNTGLLRSSTLVGDIEGVGINLTGAVAAPTLEPHYSPDVEFGREAGKTWPPEAAIAKWAEEKLGITSASVVFLIRRKIGQRGIAAKFMFQHATDTMRGRVDGIFGKWLQEWAA